jgi:hypothetical protein
MTTGSGARRDLRQRFPCPSPGSVHVGRTGSVGAPLVAVSQEDVRVVLHSCQPKGEHIGA